MTLLVARRRNASASGALRTGLAVSGVIHLSFLAALVVWGLQQDAPRPPIYRVELIGAPKGVRQAGVVTSKDAAMASTAAAPSGAERAPVEKALPSKKAPAAATPKATPSAVRSKAAGAKAASATKAALPKAGSGQDGGKGADVRNMRTEGIAFPFPGYLNNIVRQLTLAYSPRRVSAALVTEVKFVIRRDGSVTGIEIVKASGDRSFDLEAQATVESVGTARTFGPLPSGWSDDVLIVYFTFDYALRP
ncbi:MAG: TonB C-terminal domain-containing protein [Gemmatimonadaceae bacterium]|nr:TonB C-terminal domain-containing protein [Gemmatimonadaceae bacterium]